jgi:hypothetical protein
VSKVRTGLNLTGRKKEVYEEETDRGERIVEEETEGRQRK